MSTPFATLTTGQPHPASVSQIEADLSEMWHSALAPSPEHPAPTRACALTLLIYVESEEAGVELGELIRQVTLDNPCRAIVIVADSSSPEPGLTAWVSAHCHFSAEAGTQICSEEIYVVGRGKEVSNLAHVVVPLTVPGLPVYFWWRAGAFTPPPHFDEVLRVSDRIGVNSWRFSDPAADFSELAGRVHSFAGDPALTDLNWLSLTPWRQLIAQSFDSPERRHSVLNVAEVQITYGIAGESTAPPLCQALLLAGWLSSRLGWTPTGEEPAGVGRRRFRFQAGPASRSTGQRGVVIDLVPDAERSSLGLTTVLLKIVDPTPGTCSLCYRPEQKSIVTQSELAGRLTLEGAVLFEAPQEVDLLNEDLKFPTRDRIYEQALEAVTQMLGGT